SDAEVRFRVILLELQGTTEGSICVLIELRLQIGSSELCPESGAVGTGGPHSKCFDCLLTLPLEDHESAFGDIDPPTRDPALQGFSKRFSGCIDVAVIEGEVCKTCESKRVICAQCEGFSIRARCGIRCT